MNFKKYSPSEQAILTTLLYSDIFSFPLTKGELWKFLISEKNISPTAFDKGLVSLKVSIVYKNGYFCLSGREEIIAKRIRNTSEVVKKMNLAYSVVQKLSRIPSILFIGVSGGLAVGNVSKNDDIDLVVIAKKDFLFVSRLLILLYLQILGVRRSRNQRNTADTICVNLLFDETELGRFGRQQDIYTAKEIAQLVPIYEREGMYKRFLQKNSWIQSYLPNFSLSSPKKSSSLRDKSSLFRLNEQGYPYIEHQVRDNGGSKFLKIIFLNSFFESLTRFLQMSIMKRHHSIETISKHILAFHPYDYRVKTLSQLKLKMRNLGLLTKI